MRVVEQLSRGFDRHHARGLVESVELVVGQLAEDAVRAFAVWSAHQGLIAQTRCSATLTIGWNAILNANGSSVPSAHPAHFTTIAQLPPLTSRNVRL